MKSYEVIRDAVDEPGVKSVAGGAKGVAGAGVQVVRAAADEGDPEQSGAKNPLDRVREMFTLTRDIRLVRWLCNQAGGFFVANPATPAGRRLDGSATAPGGIFTSTQTMVREFSELLDAVTGSAADDAVIDPVEADLIRGKWEDLKACVETFVVDCERGTYHPPTLAAAGKR